jgi:3-oxoacyl-[acyl-carrier-protein] synthase-3
MSIDAYITAVSAVLPGAPVSNDAMEGVLGQVAGKPSRARRTILRSNGITNRHYVLDPITGEPTRTNAQLAAEAIRGLQKGGLDLGAIDCLACGTSVPDQVMPGHGVMVHGELGNPPSEVVSTAGVCVAGMTAMRYAWLGVTAGEFQNAVASASEISSVFMRARFFEEEVEAKVRDLEKRPELAFEKDFLRWMLSDGAGAVLIQPRPAKTNLSLKIEWMMIRSYANEQTACMIAAAEKQDDGSLKPWYQFTGKEWLDRSVFTVRQDVKQLNEYVMHYTVKCGLEEVKRVHKDLRPSDIDYFLPHYSSQYFRDEVFEKMQAADFVIPHERWFTNLTTKGNTGSASIYIILEELFHSGKLKPGQKLLCYVPESGRFSTAFMLLTVCAPS